MAKAKQPTNPLHTPFKEAYVNFCRNTLKMPEKFGAAEAKLTLSVISWVRKAVEIKNQGPATDEEVLGAWQLILDKYDLWGFDKGKSLTLGQIYCRLQNITESIRQQAGGKTTNGKQVGLTPEEEAELNAYNNG